MRKKIGVILILVLVIACSLSMIGCKKTDSQHEVEIVFFHPTTGDAMTVDNLSMKYGEVPERTDIVIKFRDKVTGDFLDHNDLMPYSTLETCYTIGITRLPNMSVNDGDRYHWPTDVDKYRISVTFNCVESTDVEYQRKYLTTSAVFYYDVIGG